MKARALSFVLVLYLAAPAGAVDETKAGDGKEKSVDFREMVIGAREEAREEYEAKVEERRKALLRGIARGERARPGGGNPGNLAGSVPEKPRRQRLPSKELHRHEGHLAAL